MKRVWTIVVAAVVLATSLAAVADSGCCGCKKKSADKPASTNAPAESSGQSSK